MIAGHVGTNPPLQAYTLTPQAHNLFLSPGDECEMTATAAAGQQRCAHLPVDVQEAGASLPHKWAGRECVWAL